MTALPYRWRTMGAQLKRYPDAGDLVGFEHAVWRVMSVTDRDEVDWAPEDAAYLKQFVAAEKRHARRPRVMVLRPIDVDPSVIAHTKDKHFRLGGASQYLWNVYPTEHYPVCAQCREPLPCRDQMAAQIAQQAMQQMARYETTGVCPACREVVTHRQAQIQWDDNVEIIGGPPVVFHTRRECIGHAAEYEKRWAAVDPQHRRTQLSCTGTVTNHGDGTYDCTQAAICPGPAAAHRSYTVCDCCPMTSRGCHPSPNSALRTNSLTVTPEGAPDA